MKYDNFPGLFKSSDSASNRYQSQFLRFIKAEYALLLIASALSLSAFGSTPFYIIFAGVFGLSIICLLCRALLRPEQSWYKCRALAESVKTMTWRYVMRAEPFADDPNLKPARERFRDHLTELFTRNSDAAKLVDEQWSSDQQITSEMDQIRGLPLGMRMQKYKTARIDDQQIWYRKKAIWNRDKARMWVGISVLAYAVAACLVLARIEISNFKNWPIEPLIVFASSAIGWMQIKKFNELSVAYKVTALEIGLLLPKMEQVSDDVGFSEFVSEAESAFSREHTMWIARQTS